jgi:hypothetical protein
MPVNTFDPAWVLGCTPDEARRLLRGHVVTPGEVEAVARSHYNWRRHLRDESSYWVVTSQAARILQLSTAQVAGLLDRHRLPFVTDPSGVRLMRRADVEAAAPYLSRSLPVTGGTPRPR